MDRLYEAIGALIGTLALAVFAAWKIRPRKQADGTVIVAGATVAFWIVFACIVVGGVSALYAVGKYRELLDLTPPVGSIVAWHRHFTDRMKAKPIPDGWQECDGSEIRPGEFKGMRTPNLNMPEGDHTGGRFLRGAATSGVMEEPTLIAVNPNNSIHGFGESLLFPDNQPSVPHPAPTGTTAVLNLGEPQELQIPFAAVRPRNMSVVWIMRVK